MKLIALFLSFNFFIFQQGHSATVLQVKGSSAIIQLSDAEFQSLNPKPDQQIQVFFSNEKSVASIKKISNQKILVTTDGKLTAKSTVKIKSLGSSAELNPSEPLRKNVTTRKTKMPQKPWLIGANAKLLTGSANIVITSFPNQTLKYTGFDLSAMGFYYFGDFGVGAEGEYVFASGSTAVGSNKLTQVQMNLLAEYKISSFSFGALFTVFSNIKDTDTVGSDNSLNGTGFGAFATYSVTPKVRIVLEYKMVNYALDPATYSLSDIRVGAGYYF